MMMVFPVIPDANALATSRAEVWSLNSGCVVVDAMVVVVELIVDVVVFEGRCYEENADWDW